jgi:hypothetical protein
MDQVNNFESIRRLKEKKDSSPGRDFLVRINVYDHASCADFEYIPISELIIKLENSEIVLKPEELDTYIDLS